MIIQHNIIQDVTMASFDELKIKIRTFLSKYIHSNGFTDDEHLFQKGYINSLMAIELVLFVESEFSLKVENEDLDLNNFKSVNAIAQLVDRKTSRQG